MAWNIQIPTAEWVTSQTPNLERIIREVEDQNLCSIDTETTGLNYMKDFALYWSLSWQDKTHPDLAKRVCLRADAFPYFEHIFKNPDREWAYVNAKFDLHMMHNVGADIKGKIFDCCVMHALAYEEMPHRLEFMARHLLGWQWKDDFKKGFKEFGPHAFLTGLEQTDLARLVEYASNDAYGTLQVFLKLKKELEDTGTWSLYPKKYATLGDYFFKIEAPFTRVLWKMERRGLYVNEKYINDAVDPATKEIAAVEREVTNIVGRVINLKSPDQLTQYFFREKGYQPLKMTKGGKKGIKKESTDFDVITWLAEEHNDPVAERMLVLRDLYKITGTLKGIIGNLDKDGRVHTHFNQDVARCLPKGELVLTDRGYLPVEDVVVGDHVIAHTGLPRKVTETSVHEPTSIYRVQLSNGLELRTNGSHPYRTGNTWTRADALPVGTAVTVHSNKEAWLPIPLWEPFEVSSWGRVRNVSTKQVRALQPKDEWGHLKVTLYRNGAQERGQDKKDFAVHRLVLKAFGTQQGLLEETRHLNGIAWDNTISNLKAGTSWENRQDALKHGTLSQRRAGRTILTEEAVQDIRSGARPSQASPTAKLSYEIAVEIRQAYAQGQSIKELARTHGVSFQALWNVVTKKTYTGYMPFKGRSAKELAEKYGVSEGYVREVQSGAKWKDEEYIEGSKASFFEAYVVSVTQEASEVTYGLTIEEDCSHVTGGVVTHNTGRLSTSDIQFQNIPTAENDKFKTRRAFCAEPGNRLLVIDQEQLEMRLLAAATVSKEHPEGERDMIQLFLDGKDIHMGNASLVFGIPYDDLVMAKKIDKEVKNGKLPESALTEYFQRCLEARQAAKSIGFGLNYGMKEGKLARAIKKTKAEALALMEQYMERYPAVKNFYASAIENARQCGYSYTILGRRRFHPEIVSSNKFERWEAERKAVNNEIQGTAADALKVAMILIDNEDLDDSLGCHMLNQVHDELVFEGHPSTLDEAQEIIKDIMEHPFDTDLIVPLIAKPGQGDNWLDAK